MKGALKFYTATLAKLYADQGYYSKAAEIYRHLLAIHPDRGDLRESLSAVERQMAGRKKPDRKELNLLLHEWTDLISDYKHRKQKNEQNPEGKK